MFHLYHHRDLERLAELLAVLRERAGSHPLAADTVLVPEPGVGRWLQARLAESEGVVAGVDFAVPARWIWQVVEAALPEAPDTRHYSRRRMRWHLYALLPDLGRRHPRIGAYLAAAPAELRRWQLAGELAELFDAYLVHRGDLLAQWEHPDPRPGPDLAPPADWQAPAWRALVERLGRPHRRALLETFIRACRGEPVEWPLDRGALPERVYAFGLSRLPPDYLRLLYALAHHTEVHFLLPNPSEGYWGDVVARPASLAIDPGAADLPGEARLELEHPLLASLGRPARDFLRVLYSEELNAIQEPDLGEALAYAMPGDDTLLRRIQSGIVRMAAGRDAQGMGEDDVSVQIHACHGPLREVQVLHDRLLDLLARDPTLEPRDVVVLLPDVAAYAPAIHAVFGEGEGAGAAVGPGGADPAAPVPPAAPPAGRGASGTGRAGPSSTAHRPGATRRIPYALADRPAVAGHPIVGTFQGLLELPLSRWTASEVLALAAVPAVMRRFGLDEADLDALRAWTQAAGVRWGLDAAMRRRLGAGAYEQNTWRFGLDRLLLGTVRSEEASLVEGIAPWSDLEGGAAAAVGRLWQLLQVLRGQAATLATPASATEWQDRLNGAVERLFRPAPGDRDEEAAIGAVHRAIAVLGEARECFDGAGNAPHEPLHWEAVREALRTELAGPGERQPLASGGVTFCGLVPLRAVPFRVVCLLGLNDDAFPRQERNREINLILRERRLGDPSQRDDDRFLLLQSLTAARDVLYLSYAGQDLRTGERLPPSPVVGEVLDFLHAHHFSGWPREALEDRLVIRQPMQPFSRRCFAAAGQGGASRLFTFAAEWQPATVALEAERHRGEPFDDGTVLGPPEAAGGLVALDDLKAFLFHPPRYFARARLALHLDPREVEIADEEPLALDPLGAWRVRAQLLELARRDGLERLPPEPPPLLRARGELPPPPLDGEAYAEEAGPAGALLALWRAWTAEGGPLPEPLDVDLLLPAGDATGAGTGAACAVRLAGRIHERWPDGLRRLRPGRFTLEHCLAPWVDYLAACAAGAGGTLRLAGLKRPSRKGEPREVECLAATVEPARAGAILADLCWLYTEGLRRPLPFEPRAAEDYLARLDQPKSPRTPDEALAEINAALAGRGGWNRPRYADDPYLRLVFDADGTLGGDPRAPGGFCALAERIGRPLRDALSGASGPRR